MDQATYNANAENAHTQCACTALNASAHDGHLPTNWRSAAPRCAEALVRANTGIEKSGRSGLQGAGAHACTPRAIRERRPAHTAQLQAGAPRDAVVWCLRLICCRGPRPGGWCLPCGTRMRIVTAAADGAAAINAHGRLMDRFCWRTGVAQPRCTGQGARFPRARGTTYANADRHEIIKAGVSLAHLTCTHAHTHALSRD